MNVFTSIGSNFTSQKTEGKRELLFWTSLLYRGDLFNDLEVAMILKDIQLEVTLASCNRKFTPFDMEYTICIFAERVYRSSQER